MTPDCIAVYGATGTTGTLIAERLVEHNTSVVLGGRDAEKLDTLAKQLGADDSRLETAVAGVDASDKLDAIFDTADVLINCAGPFVDCGPPVVESALRTKTHYLDTTGEQEHIRWIREHCHEEARQRDLVLMPACAFEFALGDLAAEIAHAHAASRIVVAYAVENMSMSPGTKKSVLRSLSKGGIAFVDGEHVERRTAYRSYEVPFPDGSRQKGIWVPGGEAITVPRRGGVSRVETCVVSEASVQLAAQALAMVPGLMRRLQPLADRVVDKTTPNRDRRSSEAAKFRVIAFDPDTAECHVVLRGSDVYGTTAEIAVEAAMRLQQIEPPHRGFVGPADLFEPGDFLTAVGVHATSCS